MESRARSGSDPNRDAESYMQAGSSTSAQGATPYSSASAASSSQTITPSQSTQQLNVMSSRFATHQPSIASPLRLAVRTQHVSSGSEEATPTPSPDISSREKTDELSNRSVAGSGAGMASRAQAYLESWKEGAASTWSGAPTGSSHALPLHHSPQKPFAMESRALPESPHFTLTSAEPVSQGPDSAASSRWSSMSGPTTPSYQRQNLTPGEAETRLEGVEARKPSFSSSIGGMTQGGYASSVDADFYSAPPSRLVSRTPTPVANGTGLARLSSPDIVVSTESDEEDSDYAGPTGWGATLFGFGLERSATGNRYSRGNWQRGYHSLGTRRGAKWKDVEPDTTLMPPDYSSPKAPKVRSKGYDGRGASLNALGSSAAPDVRRYHRRRKQRNSNMPTPLRVASSLLSKTFRTFFGPIHPVTIAIALILIAGFVTSVTMLIIYILNPDKEPLPWRTYCQQQMPFPHAYADALAPVNIFVGVMTIDSKYDRRNVIRNTYARHTLPMDVNGKALGNVQVKFVLGRVRKAHAKRIALEMEAYNDIVVLDTEETQSARKTLSYFKWASENATVPFLRPVGPAKGFNGSIADTYVPSANAPGGLATWDSEHSNKSGHKSAAGSKGHIKSLDDDEDDDDNDDGDNEKMRYQVAWKKADYVVKADDDSFIVLDELERHLRVAPRKMTYWGYLIKNWFMGGEAYALSFDLVNWIANSADVTRSAKGKEDTRTPQWIALHPNRSSINWVSEHCWIYDHPKAGSPYSHGFLFPDYVEKLKLEARRGLSEQEIAYRGGERRSQSYSTVTKWHQKYAPPRVDMTVEEEVEALIEGGGRWEGTWVRGADGSTSETWVPYHDIVYQSDDVRLRPSATNQHGSAVLASDVGFEPYSSLPIYGPVDRTYIANTTSASEPPQTRPKTANGKAASPEIAAPAAAQGSKSKRDILSDLSSLPRKLLGYQRSSAEEERASADDDDGQVHYIGSASRVLPRPTPKDGHGEWASLRASRYLNRPHGGTVVVHYLKKTEWWLETALALSGRPKLWQNGAGGRGKDWRMGGSPLVRGDGYILEGRSAPRRATLPLAPTDEGEDALVSQGSGNGSGNDNKKKNRKKQTVKSSSKSKLEIAAIDSKVASSSAQRYRAGKGKVMAPSGNTPFGDP